MSQKPTKKQALAPGTASAVEGRHLLPEELQRVQELIAGRHSKAALQLAKDLFKRSSSPESENLLVNAYNARIGDLLKLGLSVEAKALLAIVRERFPAAAARFDEHHLEICAIEGKLDGVVGPLGDQNLSAEDRDRIETFIRQRVHDLPALAVVSSLLPEHPLRRAASALASAFQAVTEGPVDDALLALPEVSRRSPLAPWKALVRAIASYHRRDDAECKKWLLTIADDSVPARLVPALAGMMGTRNGAKFSPAEQKLIAVAGDHDAVLRSALAALEEALKIGKQERILDATRTAVAAMHSTDEKTRMRLRQHVAVRAGMQHLHHSVVHAALGGLPRWDAYYFRLLARSLEELRKVESAAEAVIVWEDFRRQAIQEKWFAANTLEDGLLSLHLAQLMERIPPQILAELRHREAQYSRTGKAESEEVLPSPGRLYERGCKADPSFEAFQLWLNWAANTGPWQAADHAAECWRMARPRDIQPLLHLMESAEKRSAYQKSLKYLQEAEKLDRLNPDVRRAKLRLLLSAAIRHLRQGKTRLAKSEVEQIEGVPEVRSGEVAALAAALRWCCAALDLDPADRLRQEENLQQSIGDVGAYMLVASLTQAVSLGATATPPLLQVSRVPAEALLVGVVKACLLGQWAGLPILLPRAWNAPLIAAQRLPEGPLDAAQRMALGETAIDSGLVELAYDISTSGLAGGIANARFLFLRARCLPHWASLRHDGCCLAALELARRDREPDLAGKILDRLGQHQRGRPVPPELLSLILEEEQELKELPVYPRYREPRYAAQLGFDRSDPWDGDEHEDEFDDEEDVYQPAPQLSKRFMKRFEKILGQLPPALTEQVKRDMAAGDDPIAVLEKALAGFPPMAASAQKSKAANAPLPEQGSLF